MFLIFNSWLVDNAVIINEFGHRYVYTWRGEPLFCAIK